MVRERAREPSAAVGCGRAGDRVNDSGVCDRNPPDRGAHVSRCSTADTDSARYRVNEIVNSCFKCVNKCTDVCK